MTKDKFNAIVDELWGEVNGIDPKMYEYYEPFQEQIYGIIISAEVSSNLVILKKKTIEFMVALNTLYTVECGLSGIVTIKPLMEHSKETLIKKATEYATEIDRLYNFKRAGGLIHKEPEEALIGMASKHFVSVEDILNSPKMYSQKFMLEKFGDAVNYLILLYALIEDRENEN